VAMSDFPVRRCFEKADRMMGFFSQPATSTCARSCAQPTQGRQQRCNMMPSASAGALLQAVSSRGAVAGCRRTLGRISSQASVAVPTEEGRLPDAFSEGRRWQNPWVGNQRCASKQQHAVEGEWMRTHWRDQCSFQGSGACIQSSGHTCMMHA
jgi:hypothetical protein